jgi:chromosome segregation ATPase
VRKFVDKVRLSRRISLLIVLTLSSFSVALAQSSTVETLRSQLSDAQKRDEQLQARLKQIEEDMKPENIEKVFALNGSTRPEELREQRRRQLETERTNVRAQLDQLAQSRVRLETAIATAEAAAYRQSALPASDSSAPPIVTTTPDSPTVVKPKQTQRRTRRARRARRRG